MKKNTENQSRKLHIRAGDTVMVIAGDAKGSTGLVKQVLIEKQRAIVEGLNLVKKHVKPSATNPEGGIIEKEAGIHISNLQILDTKTNKPTRVGRKVNEKTGKSERVTKKSNAVVVHQILNKKENNG